MAARIFVFMPKRQFKLNVTRGYAFSRLPMDEYSIRKNK